MTTRLFPYPRDSYIDLFRPQRNSNEAAGEVSLLLLQQVLALVQGDVEQPRPLAGVPGRLELQGDLQLAHREVVAEVVGDGGDGAERVGGNGAVELGHPRGVQLPAHQLQVAQVPETVRRFAQRQAGLAAGCGGRSPMVVGGRPLQEGGSKVKCALTGWGKKTKQESCSCKYLLSDFREGVPIFLLQVSIVKVGERGRRGEGSRFPQLPDVEPRHHQQHQESRQVDADLPARRVPHH